MSLKDCREALRQMVERELIQGNTDRGAGQKSKKLEKSDIYCEKLSANMPN
ncbi:hypothetical protein [Levilactobacillus sp. HBUAS67488]|uniref:hypothetical protein n=1 Tax=Levilactobacillus sp. HBUAS67488 TaxID=3109361 RepID=UPI002FEEED1A